MKKNVFRATVSKVMEILLSLAVGAVCGFAISAYCASIASGISFGKYALCLMLGLLAIALAAVLQIILHEAGHLVFGLMSGYQFSSFRVGSLMLLKAENGRLSLRKVSIAGTVGQCLMSPPDIEEDGYLPVGLYNMGGVIMNLISAMLFLWAYFFSGGTMFLSVLFLALSIFGLGFALMNGVPMKISGVCNDGCNALSLGKDPAALEAFWTQLKINEQTAKGKQLRDMPWEWFLMPSEEQMKNSLCASMAVFRANRLMDEHHFTEAERLMDELLDGSNAIPDLYINLLVCDRIYCELLGNNDTDMIKSLMTKKQQRFMKQMGSFPSVIRTRYALALLHEKDREAARAAKLLFENCAKSYPYASDIQSERELMDLVDKAAE